MKKRIRSLIFEMVIVLGIIVGTYFIWDNMDYSNEAQIAYAYSKYDAHLSVVINKNIEELYVVSDENASVVSPLEFSINNSNTIDKDYSLFIRIDNRSTVDVNNLKINYNGKTYTVGSLKSYERDNSVFYKITKGEINKKSTIENKMTIYLSNTNTDVTDQVLSFGLYVEEA